jgi:hypothetical protein
MARTRVDKLPTSLDGDPICYHRLTGHMRWTLDDVFAAAGSGFALLSYEERVEQGVERGTIGLDPIDVGAGDGAGIYLNPGAPLDPSRWAGFRAESLRSPGVGFRLSTLRSLGRVTLRPSDLQGFYQGVNRVYAGSPHDYEDPTDHYTELREALSAIRVLGEKDATRAVVLAAVDRVGLPANALTPRERERAIYAVANANYDCCGAGDEDDDGDDGEAEIAAWLDGAEEKIAEAWAEMPAPEVVFWGGVLPLLEADVVFGADGAWAYRERGGLLGLGRGGWIRG